MDVLTVPIHQFKDLSATEGHERDVFGLVQPEIGIGSGRSRRRVEESYPCHSSLTPKFL